MLKVIFGKNTFYIDFFNNGLFVCKTKIYIIKNQNTACFILYGVVVANWWSVKQFWRCTGKFKHYLQLYFINLPAGTHCIIMT